MINRDAATFLAWAAANLVVALASWRVAGALSPGEGTRRRCLGALVLGLGLITAVVTVLGAVRQLRPYLCLAIAAIVAAAFWCLFSRWPVKAGRVSLDSSPISRALRSCLPAFGLGYAAVKSVSEFTTEYDSIMYHIPLIDYWIQARALFAPSSMHWASPGGNELIGLWFVGPFSGDFLVRFSNIPTTLLLVLAAAEFSSLLGIRRPLDQIAGLAVASNFVVVSQLADPGNDVAVVAFFLAGLCYSLRYCRSGRGADLCLGAACLGLLAGVKYYALGYAAILWISLFRPALRARCLGHAVRAAAASLLVAFALGGYWYVRNVVVSGTPFFPMGFTPGTGELARNYPDAWRSSFIGNGRPEVPAMAMAALWKMTGICHLAAVLGLPLILPWLLLSGRRDRRTLAVLILASGFMLMITPFAVEDRPGSLNHLWFSYTPVRYGLCFLSTSVIALALALQSLAHRFRSPGSGRGVVRTLPAILMGGAAASQVLFPERRLSIDWFVLGPLILNIAVLSALRADRSVRPRQIVFAAATALAVGAALVGWLSQAWDEQFTRAYDRLYGTSIFGVLRSFDRDGVRLCLLDYRCHPFFGARRQFRLSQPLHVPSSARFGEQLRRQGVDLVVMRSFAENEPVGWDAFARRDDLRRALGDGATLIHSDAAFTLYSMQAPPASAMFPAAVVDGETSQRPLSPARSPLGQ